MSRERKDGSETFGAFALLHLLCCGLPLLVLAFMSLGLVFPRWPVIAAVLAVIGVVGFVWYLKRRCPTCPRNNTGTDDPNRNERGGAPGSNTEGRDAV